jgi:hypothetical protein
MTIKPSGNINIGGEKLKTKAAEILKKLNVPGADKITKIDASVTLEDGKIVLKDCESFDKKEFEQNLKGQLPLKVSIGYNYDATKIKTVGGGVGAVLNMTFRTQSVEIKDDLKIYLAVDGLAKAGATLYFRKNEHELKVFDFPIKGTFQMYP